MTTPSSCNGFFKKYLIYKLRAQTIPFIVSALLNVLLLPPFAIEMLMIYNGITVTTISYNFMMYMPAVITFIMALTGAPRTFSFCTKSNCVDTLGSLPLTRKQHFAADFLSGYIVNVGPSIPCSIFSIIIAALTNGKFAEQFIDQDGDLYIIWFVLLTLSLFAAYSFAYIVSVFVTICCGKKSTSIIFTITISVLLISSAAGIGTFAEQCVTGASSNNVDFYLSFIPPLGFLYRAYRYYQFMAGIDLTVHQRLDTPNPFLIFAFILMGAAIICASYYIFKNRKAERTGRPIASNVVYRVMCALGVITVTSVSFSAAYPLHAVWIPLLISIVITAVLLLILEAVRGFKKAGLLITGARGLITVFIVFAALMIVDGSGAFGARYINVSPNEVRSLRITEWKTLPSSIVYSGSEKESCIFTDQKEIEEFIDNHNQTVKEHSKDLMNGFIFQVDLTLNNGETIKRKYSPNSFRIFSNSNPSNTMNELSENLHSLGSYSTKASESYKNNFLVYGNNDIKLQTLGVFGEVAVPREKVTVLSEIFTNEFREKYKPTDKIAGMIKMENRDMYSRKVEHVIYIPSSCTETLAFADELRTNDPNCEALTIWCYRKTNYTAGYTFDRESLNTELGQEMLSLLSTDKSTESPDRANRYDITSTDMNDYYVPAENSERFFEVLLDMIEAEYSEDQMQ